MPIRPFARVLATAFLAVAVTFLAAATLSLSPTSAWAATGSVDQCNGVGPDANGATTGMTCTVEVWNTISSGVTSSTLTVTRQCSLGPCAPGNGTFTSTSTDLITDIQQCNGSDNDAAHTITCTVTVHNTISGDTPGALPLSTATVNQCVGSASGSGVLTCAPFPANTTGATVTQCNGSGNGGGASVNCTVATSSNISGAIPLQVHQCNGSGNPGGSTVSCSVAIDTVVVPAAPTATATPTVSATPTATPATTPTASPTATPPSVLPTTGSGGAGTTGSTGGSGSTPTGSTTTVVTPGTTNGGPVVEQVRRVPRGGVEAGGGSTANVGGRSSRALGLVLVAAAALLAAVAIERRRRSCHQV
ncbi:MAG: hypothetical protein JWL79_1755 [Frankiales bacterium]|nr:hypothetical protein [Frankiales bacterium]